MLYILVSMRFIQDDATNHRSSHATNDNNETNSTSVDLCTLRRKGKAGVLQTHVSSSPPNQRKVYLEMHEDDGVE